MDLRLESNYTSQRISNYVTRRQLFSAVPRRYHARQIDERKTQMARRTNAQRVKLLAAQRIFSCAFFFAPLGAVAAPAKDAKEVYSEDFDAPVGTKFPQWTSSAIEFRSAVNPPGQGPPVEGKIEPSPIVNSESANGTQRFLGEFGGPKIGTPADPGWNRTAVRERVRLQLDDLPPHRALRVAFDLYVLKSWDGNSPQYGPDRLKLAVDGGPTLVDTSFSNNHKVERQGSYQDYPKPKSAPQTGAKSTDTQGFEFFGDAIYRLEFEFPHHDATLALEFTSDLFEGKGTGDESWGIDNLKIETLETAR
jgi:hypothetical protein